MIVRPATAADSTAIGGMLAAAFHDYAWTRWTVDAADHPSRVDRLQQLALTELVLPFGEAWVAQDNTTIVSAAMWMRPDSAVPDAVLAAMEPRLAELEGDRHAASRAAEAFLAPHRRTDPSYFLGAVGTDPARQRVGFGRAVLAPVLDRVRAERASACLETCGADNVRFYEGLGFEVTAEATIPAGGPTVLFMALC